MADSTRRTAIHDREAEIEDQVDPPESAEEIQADIERMYREEL